MDSTSKLPSRSSTRIRQYDKKKQITYPLTINVNSDKLGRTSTFAIQHAYFTSVTWPRVTR